MARRAGNVPIRWKTGDLAGPVSISLLWGYDLIDEITPSTPNDGSYMDYDVPLGLTPGSEYRILVYHIDSGASGLSEYFEVRQRIVVTEPTSATIWDAGQKGVPVSWITGNLGGSVSINLYRGAAFVRELISGYINSGTGLVDVPSDIPAGSDYRIQVYRSADYSDFSDRFSIRDTSFVVAMPDTNTTWMRGQQYVAIRWKPGSTTGNVAIGLYRGGVLVETVALSTPNDGEYSDYIVPAGLAPGTDYRIRVDSDAGRYDLSENFEIAKPSGWTWMYPSTGGYRLNSVCFTDANTGTAVGEYGTILRTTDGGATWARRWGSTRKKLLGVDFIDANTGLAVGEGGLILKTTDGGATWVGKTAGFHDGDLYSIAFADADTVVAVGALGGATVFCRSTDGGETWTSAIRYSSSMAPAKSVSFSDAKNGAALAEYGGVYWTNDGGVTWNGRIAGGDYNHCISVLDANTWVIGVTTIEYGYYGLQYIGEIRVTRNAGATWGKWYSGRVRPYSISFADATTGTAVGLNGGILRTTNGGSIWTPQASGLSTSLYGVSFTDANTGTAVGDYGRIVRTTDGGAAWTSQPPSTGATLYDISFSNENEGIIVGGSGLSGVVLRTTDAGATWSSQSTTGGALSDISMANADTGVAVGDYYDCSGCDAGFPPTYHGVILRTIDGGATWTTQSSPRLLLRCLWLMDSNNGIVFGQGDSYAVDELVVLRTQDGGATWTSQPFAFSISDVWFSDANTGTAIGVQGRNTSDVGRRRHMDSANERHDQLPDSCPFLRLEYRNGRGQGRSDSPDCRRRRDLDSSDKRHGQASSGRSVHRREYGYSRGHRRHDPSDDRRRGHVDNTGRLERI